MRLFAASIALAGVVSLAGSAVAADPASSQVKDSGGGKAATPGAANPESSKRARTPRKVRRDPEGIKGISPLVEAMFAGDRAYVAGNLETAADHYRQAIKLDSQKPIAHTRLGRVLLSAGDEEGAEREWLEASKLASKHLRQKAKVLLLLADLRERQGRPQKATSAYQVYRKFTKGHPDARGFPETAESRIERIEHYQKLSEDYVAVKERIRQRAEEAEERLKESSR